MDAKVTIELSDGTVLSGILSGIGNTGMSHTAPLVTDSGKVSSASHAAELDYTMPIRPFMNEHAEGLSGSKKFALVVAYFAKGEIDAPVDRAEAVEAWNKMTGLMGGKFNGAHESRAKDSGWIYVPQAGTLALLKKWKQALA